MTAQAEILYIHFEKSYCWFESSNCGEYIVGVGQTQIGLLQYEKPVFHKDVDDLHKTRKGPYRKLVQTFLIPPPIRAETIRILCLQSVILVYHR